MRKRRHDIAPGFWEAIREGAKSGMLASPMSVYNEIAKGGDDLAKWAGLARSVNLFTDPDKEVQAKFSQVAVYIMNPQHHSAQSSLFMRGADPWVVSFAFASGGTVVTHEKLVPANSSKVKIPNVCRHFGVPYMNSYDMLRALGIKLR